MRLGEVGCWRRVLAAARTVSDTPRGARSCQRYRMEGFGWLQEPPNENCLLAVSRKWKYNSYDTCSLQGKKGSISVTVDILKGNK